MIERYTRKELKELWSDEVRFKHMLDVELAATHAFMEIGVVPNEDYEYIKTNSLVDIEKIKEIEALTNHDVIAFTKAVSLNLGDKAKWFHYGLTSTDVVDTALALTIKKANDIILNDLNKFIAALKHKAYVYKNTPIMGRTHGMHAEITSFGLKFALWFDEMERNLDRFNRARKVIEVGKISGAVGNFANTKPIIEEKVCSSLGIGHAAISTQVLSRDRHIEYITSLALIASTLQKIATEIRHLSRNEVGEVSEHFSKTQKGSSAMPHKKNPISSENICGLARVVISYVNVAFDNNILWHERDISHSSSERIILADATTLIDYMLNRYTKVIENLSVNEDKMLENINLTKGVIFSGRIVNFLCTKGIDRTLAYDDIQKLCMESFNKNIDFKSLLCKSKYFDLIKYDMDYLFNIEFYLEGVKDIYRRLGLE